MILVVLLEHVGKVNSGPLGAMLVGQGHVGNKWEMVLTPSRNSTMENGNCKLRLSYKNNS